MAIRVSSIKIRDHNVPIPIRIEAIGYDERGIVTEWILNVEPHSTEGRQLREGVYAQVTRLIEERAAEGLYPRTQRYEFDDIHATMMP